VAYEAIERIAQEEAAKGWEQRRLGSARRRIADEIVSWMSGLFEGHLHGSAQDRQANMTRGGKCRGKLEANVLEIRLSSLQVHLRYSHGRTIRYYRRPP
jgi:hypothetical protein